ncbi:MAG: glycosyltransferase family 39 protein [Lachnospiraceae bacterium]|nr:glycosyltransferase family 39 protein [Lachnospiraceae bacterium]
MKKIINTKTTIYLSAFAGMALYISLIFNNNLWVDESFTACIVRENWPEVWKDTVADTLPPFFNYFAKLLTVAFGYSAPVMKFAAALPMILCLILAATGVRKLFGNTVSLIYIALLASMPELYYYGVEIRPYSWGFFFCSAAAFSAAAILKTKRTAFWISLGVSIALAGWTHHFALISAGMLLVWLTLYTLIFSRESLKKLLLCIGITFVLYFPYFIIAIYQIKNASSYFSMSPLSFHSLMSDIRYPFVTHATVLSLLLLAFVALSAAGSAISALKSHSAATLHWLPFMSITLLTTLFGYAVSALSGSSIFTARYLFPSLGIFWFGASLLFGKCLELTNGSKIYTIITVLVILSVGICTYSTQFSSEYDKNVKYMTEFFDNNVEDGDGYVIYESAYQIENCMRYYYPDLKKYDLKNIDKITGNVWYFLVDGYEDELDHAIKSGLNFVYVGDFAFDRYSFKLYRLETN